MNPVTAINPIAPLLILAWFLWIALCLVFAFASPNVKSLTDLETWKKNNR